MYEQGGEMSLFDFCVLCWRKLCSWLKALGMLVLRSVRLGLRYWYVMVVAAVSGLCAGCLWSSHRTTRYTGDVTILVTPGMRPAVKKGLEIFVASDPEQKVACGVGEEQVWKIKRINFYNVIDAKADSTPDFVDYKYNVGYEDTVNVVMQDRIAVRIVLKGDCDFGNFQTAIRNSLRGEAAIMYADSVCKSIERSKLDYLNHEVARLDSFVTFDYFRTEEYGQIERGSLLMSKMSKPLYVDDMKRLMKRRDYQQAIVDVTPDIVNFESAFVVSSMRIKDKYLISLAVSIIFGLLVSWGVSEREKVVGFLRQR